MQDMEARILQAARTLLLHYGFDKTTLSNIADEAGVARSTVYKRWKKKEDIFQAVLMRESRIFLADIAKRIEADPEGGTFTAFFKHGFMSLRENDFLFALYTNDLKLLGKYMSMLDLGSMYAQRLAFSNQFLRAMQQAGTVRQNIDVATVGFVISSMQLGMLRMIELMDDDYIPAFDRMLDVTTGMIQRYIEPEVPGDMEAGKAVLKQYMDAMLKLVDSLDQPE